MSTKVSSFSKTQLIVGLFAGASSCCLGVPAMAQPGSNTAPPGADSPPAAATVSPTGNAPAAPQGAQLQEIIVTAQRRSENLQNVPVAVTALNASALTSAGIQTTAELPQAVPGLTFNTQLGGFGQPRIRGIGVAGNGPGIENPVATYIDGVYYGSAINDLLNLNDVAQVAVLKGPQGTLFGRNATGGLIQVTTKDPSQSFSGDIAGTVGSRGTEGADAYVTGGLTDKLAASATLHMDNLTEGFGRNLATNQDVQVHHAYATREKLLFEPDAATKFVLSADYAYRDSSDFAPRVLDNQVFVGTPTPGGPRDVDLSTQPKQVTRSYGVSLTGQHDFGPVKLVSITAARNSVFNSRFDGDQGPADLITVQLDDRDEQVSQELQLLSTGLHRFNWQVGFFYYWDSSRFDPFTTYITYPESPPAQSVLLASEGLTSYAAYGQGSYDLGYATSLTAGIRYTIDQRSINNNSTYSTAFFTAPPVGGTASKNFDAPSWRFSLDHKFPSGILGYISYNRGFKGGAFDASAIPAVTLKPETLDAYEIGLKSEFLDHRVRLNVAGFYYDYKNIQVTQFSNQMEIVYNGEGATSYGIDLDLIARITAALSLNAGLSVINAHYGNFPNAFQTTPNPPCVGFGCGGDAVTLTDNATGHELQNTPDYTFNIGPQYRFTTARGDVVLAANYYKSGGYYSEPENRLRQPSYNVFDASVTWSSPNDRYDVRLWGKNLTDEVYASQLNAIDDGDARIAAPGRTVGVTAGLHF